MSTSRKMMAAAVVLAMTLAVTACGAGGDGEPVAEARSVVEVVKEAGVLRVGVAPAPPYTDLNTDTNEWQGVAADLARAWADQLGVEVNWVPTTFGVMVAGLQSGTFDMTPVLNETPERQGSVSFSEPIVTALSGAAVKASGDIASWEELDTVERTICVASGSSDDAALTGAEPAATILRLADLNACRLALQSDRADAVFDEWHSLGQFAAVDDTVGVIFPPEPLGEQNISAALSTSATEADMGSINQAIAQFRDSGALAESMRKWGAANPVAYAIGTVPVYVSELAEIEFGS